MVDLPSQLVSVEENNLSASFEISSYKKNNLLNGFDDIDYLLNIKNEINDFAKKTLF
jgi:3-isopropylmalate/(R)-2-methylmalate dehydratase small subunit